MKYTIVLTEKPEGGIRVSVPALPNCTVEADNRDDALRQAREVIAQTVSRSEILYIEVPQQPKAETTNVDLSWEWFGANKDDPTWDALFEDIERRHDATRRGK